MNDAQREAEGAERAAQATEVAHRFEYHPPRGYAVEEAHGGIRQIMGEAAQDVLREVPPGREQSLAITHLEEAMFWANAGIARKQGEGR